MLLLEKSLFVSLFFCLNVLVQVCLYPTKNVTIFEHLACTVIVIPLLLGSVASLDTALYSTLGNEGTDFAFYEVKILLVIGIFLIDRDNNLIEVAIEYPAENDTSFWHSIQFKVID